MTGYVVAPCNSSMEHCQTHVCEHMYTCTLMYVEVEHFNPTYPQPYSVSVPVKLEILITRVTISMYTLLEYTIRRQQA